MLTPYLPYPPSSGGQIRSYNLIKQLSKKHQITLCSLIKYDEEEKYVDQLKQYCENVYIFKRAEKPWTLINILKTGLSLHPFLVVRNFSTIEKKIIAKILAQEKFDIIHAETFYVSPHIPDTEVPLVLVDQTIEYQVYQHYVQQFRPKILRPLLYLDVLKIKFWEIYYWKKASMVVAVSERDEKIMKQLVPGLKVSVIPNGVGEDLIGDIPLHYSKTLMFMGNYAWLQNIEAARILVKEVFPLILQEVPDTKLVIAGQNTDKISNLQSPSVTLINLKMEDIEGVKKAYQTSGILVAPLYGPGGTRLKILGAMASKLPVVTTDVGIEGIEAVNGVAAFYGKSPKELAALAIKLLNNRNLYNTVALNGRRLVEKSYAYSAIAQKLDDVYRQVSGNRG